MFNKSSKQTSFFSYFEERDPILFIPAIADNDIGINQVFLFKESGHSVIRAFPTKTIAERYIKHLKSEWSKEIKIDLDCIILKVKYKALYQTLNESFQDYKKGDEPTVCVLSLYFVDNQLFDLTEIWRQLPN